MANKHFVVQGAVCKCTFGNISTKLQVTNTNEFMNDHSGATKPVASSNETGNPFQPGTFGACTFSHSSCMPAVVQWQGCSSNITLSNGGKVLTEDSTAICAVSGSPCISILYHGQTATANVTTTGNKKQENSKTPNVLSPARDRLPEIRSISLMLKERTPVVTFISNSIKDNTPLTVVVRINESLSFNVDQYNNKAALDESLVGWKVFNGHSFENILFSFEGKGPFLPLSFDDTGNYRVMAYGEGQTNTSAYFDITATVNKLRDDFTATDRIGTTSAFGEKQFQKDVTVRIAAVYDIVPATPSEKQCVSMQVTDNNNNVLAASETDSICFTPPNAATKYVVTAIMHTGINSQIVTRTFISEKSDTILLTNHPGNHLVRPRTSMSFHVSEMIHTTLLPTPSAAAIQWLLNGKHVGIGPSLTLDGDTHFTIPGKYLVEVLQSFPNNGHNETAPVQGRGEWRLEVKNNELLQIGVANGNTNWLIGKFYRLCLQTLMPYDESLDGIIMWKPYGAGGTTMENATASGEGRFTISARLGRSAQSLEVNAAYATIDRWCFTDQQNIYKPNAGWKENIRICISSPAAAAEIVSAHLLLFNPANRAHHIKDLGFVSFDTTGELKMDISTYSLKPLLTATSFEWDTFNILFAIEQIANSIQFADMKTLVCNGRKFWFPQKQSNRRTAETGKYLRIKSAKEVVAVHIFDSQKHPAYKVYKYGEKITLHIQTSNLAGEKLLIQIWENKLLDEDKCCISKSIQVDENEISELIIDTLALKTGNFLEEGFFRCFYIVIKINTGKYLYPAEVADKNILNPNSINYYRHIKLSNRLDSLLNDLTRKNAPVVLGESLGEDTFEKDCPRCKSDLTVGQLLQIFPKADPMALHSVVYTYNRYMALTGMNTCWNKAHFFSQVGVESGMCLHIKNGESFNYYWDDLLKHFPPFRTTEGRRKAREWGRSVRKPAQPGVSTQNQQHIANYIYGPDTAKGISLGNTYLGDGWNFRGRGLIQITGREAYALANSYTIKENADIINHPDLVASDMKIAVLSAMAFWRSKGLQAKANGGDSNSVSKLVGKELFADGKSNYAEKEHLLRSKTAVVFQAEQCHYGKTPVGKINRYCIYVEAFKYTLVQANPRNGKFQYDLYSSDRLIKSFLLEQNGNGLVPFPETGPNWGRFGSRDGGDDNYIAPEIAAPLFGFFYSLPQNGYKDKLYFNDISASNKRNLGHIGHINGNDIDIRYPGSTDRPGSVLWNEAKEVYGSEREFLKVLENILRIAGVWGFKKNYGYKIGIKNTTGASTTVHKNHFHLGFR